MSGRPIKRTLRGAHGRRPTSAHHDFVVASTHPGRARSARVTGHVCRQLVSGDHLHQGLLGYTPTRHLPLACQFPYRTMCSVS